jgi:hypothetical protein
VRFTDYTATALDRAIAPERSVAVLGPIAGLDAERIHMILEEIGGSAAGVRAALEPQSHSRRWQYRNDIADQAVSVRPDLDTADLGKLAIAIRNQPDDRSPLDVLICGDYLVVDYSHGLGDGRFAVMLLGALAGAGEPEHIRPLAQSLPSHAVWTACRRHLAARPDRLCDVLRVRRKHKGGFDEQSAERRITDWKAACCTVTAYMDPDKVAELRAWTSAHVSGATSASVTIALTMSALRAEGVRIDHRVRILIDCRRYLRPEYQDANGNFVVAVPIRMPAPPSPLAITGTIREVTQSGWPAAILGIAELKARLRTTTQRSSAAAVDVSDRLRLTVSDLGRVRGLDNLPWAVGGRRPQLAAYTEPAGPDAVSLLVAELEGGRTYSASFCGEFAQRSTIERAFSRMCADPIGVLEIDHPWR